MTEPTTETGGPSPYVSIHFTRKQAEELLGLIRRHPHKRWDSHKAAVLKALRKNANGKSYGAGP